VPQWLINLGFNLNSGRISSYMSYSLICLVAVRSKAVSLMLGVTTHPASRKGNDRARYPATDRRPVANPAGSRWHPACGVGGGPVPPDPAVFADAVARYQALAALGRFRLRLYDCLTTRADALFELVDAILCADHAVTSLVQLSLVPEFRRGHGALYDSLAAGRIDDEKLAALLTATLPQLVDGDEGRAWTAGHDVIDCALLERALAGVPARDAARVRDGCARGTRLRFAVDATAYPRPGAGVPPDAATCTTARATARTAARRTRAGNTSSSPRSCTRAPRSSTPSAPPPPPAPARPSAR
jgi:DDE superfamily endonuclease